MGRLDAVPTVASLRIQHVAGGSLRNRRVVIGLQQEAFRHDAIGGSGDRSHAACMVAVTFLDRRPRIAGHHPLRERLGERDPATLVITHLTLVKTRRRDVPAQVRTERGSGRRRSAPPATSGGLLCDMSIGFTRKNVAMYSTFPAALAGARSMSLMIVLCGSFGSSSPYTWPAIVSYWPAVPYD